MRYVYRIQGENLRTIINGEKAGYVPYMLDRDEVIEVTEVLKNLYMALGAMNNGAVVSFKEGETLYRFYDEEEQLWINLVVPMQIPEISVERIKLIDVLKMLIL